MTRVRKSHSSRSSRPSSQLGRPKGKIITEIKVTVVPQDDPIETRAIVKDLLDKLIVLAIKEGDKFTTPEITQWVKRNYYTYVRPRVGNNVFNEIIHEIFKETTENGTLTELIRVYKERAEAN